MTPKGSALFLFVSMAQVICWLIVTLYCVCVCVCVCVIQACSLHWMCVYALRRVYCLQVRTCSISRGILGGEGQIELGVQVPDKLLDLTNLPTVEVERWVSRPVTLTRTHKQTHLHNSVNNTTEHTAAGRLCQYTQLEHVVFASR